MGAEGNPRYNMKSTWRTADRKEWTVQHWLIELLGIHPQELNKEVPIHAKDDKMPYLSQLELHKWILLHALWPLAVQQLYVSYTGRNFHPVAAFFFYSLAFKINAIHELNILRRLGHRYGFLDGDKHQRDEVPDNAVSKVFSSLSLTSSIRPMMTIFLAYRSAVSPAASLSWWLPLELGLYGIVLDFFFYWYHRAMHEFDYLWKYHRTHHLTKHPNPLLTLFADHEQELFDIIVIPLLTYLTLRFAFCLPMGFGDWWVCHQYIVFVELFGHSGLRVWSLPPSTNTPLLEWLDMELVTEDHDLHHRKGWKQSYNYGKQTRVWDKLFGTTTERIEAVKENVDYGHLVRLPLLW